MRIRPPARPSSKPPSKAPSKPLGARRPVVEEVEPRILYSADFSPGLLDDSAQLQQPEQRLLDGSGEFVSVSESTALQGDVGSSDVVGTTPEDGWELELLLGDEATSAAPSDQMSTGSTDAAELGSSPEAAVASTPLAFEYNVGQTDDQVDFLARGSGYAVWLTGGDAVIALEGGDGGHVLRLDVVDGDPAANVFGEELLDRKSNYLIGSQDQWHTDVDNYAAVRYEDIYTGVDLRYYANQHQLEYDFILDPGARVESIRLEFEGDAGVSLAEDGDLIITLDETGKVVAFEAPVAYQDGPEGRERVTSRYVIYEDGTVGFEVGAYDTSRTLVIDPILSYATYFGGSADEAATGIAVDAAGNVYMTGYTASAGLPTTVGAYQPNLAASDDVVVTKFTPDLSGVGYVTYVGGTGEDRAWALAVDESGNAYVTGYTRSNNFPTVSYFSNSRGGGQDAFVFKLNAAGNALAFSTYFGAGGSTDSGYGIAVDSASNVYVTGYISGNGFPVTAGAFDITEDGGDAFVTKFSPTGNTLIYSTLIGGNDVDLGLALAVDAGGNAVIVGRTYSSSFFPLVNAYQAIHGGDRDAFVTKLNSTGTAVTYSTYLGGGGSDDAYAVKLGPGGKIYLSGTTGSFGLGTPGALQTAKSGNFDAFASIIDPALSGVASLTYSTYLGGSGTDESFGIGVDGAGRMYVTGYTDSPDFWRTADAHQSTLVGSFDAFVTVIDPQGTGTADLDYGTYLGGGNAEIAWAAAYRNGKFYVAGETQSAGIATAGAYDTGINGGRDAYVAAFTFNEPPVVTVNATPLAYTENAGAQPLDLSFTVTDPDSTTLAGATLQFTANYVVGEDSLSFTNAFGITGTWSAASGTLTLTGVSSVANYQLALRSITYTNVSQAPSTLTRSIRVTVSDGETVSAPVVRQINVTSVNDVPAISAPTPQTVDEDGTLVFSSGNGNAIAVNDLDAGSNPVQLTLTATNGVLSLSQTTGLTFSTGDGTSDVGMTFTGTIANINAALNGMSFKPNADLNGSAGVVANMSDLGNTGSPGPQIANRTVAISVTAVDDAPLNTVPGPQSTAQNTPLVFSLGNGNAIGVADIDVGAGELRLSLSAINGVLTLGSTAGLSLFAGNGTSAVVAIGTAASLNAALNGLAFTPNVNYNGAASLTLVTDDQGNSGAGGPLTDSDTIAITVANNVPPSVTVPGGVVTYAENGAPVAVAPTLTVNDPDNPQLASAVVRIAAGFASGEDELSFVDPGGIAGIWNSAAGTLTLTGAASPALYEAALRSVVYRNLSDDPNPALRTISFVVNDSVTDGVSVTRDLQVLAINDPPTIVAPVVQAVDEDTALTFSTVFGNQVLVSDLDAGSGQVELALAVNDGVLTLAQTTGLTVLSGGDGTSFMTVSGALADVNAALQGLRFDPDADFSGAATLDLAVSDLGNSGSGGPIGALHTVSIDVQAVNDAAILFMPAPQSVAANGALVFALSNGNAIVVDDLDAGASTLRVALSVLDGSLTLGSTSGLIGLSGNGTSAVTFEASLSDLAAALEGLIYMPTTGFVGPTSLLLQIDDQGNSGSGGALLTSGSLDIDVVYSAPTLTATLAPQAYTENDPPIQVDAAVSVAPGTSTDLIQASVQIVGNYLNGEDLLAFAAVLPGGVSATWDAPSGQLTFSGNASVAQYETLLRSVTYRNMSEAPSTAPRLLSFAVDDGLGTASATRQVMVAAVNDAPSVSAILDQALTEGGSSGVLSFVVADAETAPGALIVTATSTDQLRVPDAGLMLGGSGVNRTIVVVPAADAYGGPVTITLSVSDGSTVTLETFDITIAPIVDSTVVVTTAADVVNGDISSIDALLMNRGADGLISLREAILAANNTPNGGTPDRIHFNIAGAGPHTIDVTSALPGVSDSVILDATTQPGFTGAPLIELNGTSAGAGVHGLWLTGGASTVRGLVVNRFDGAGIRVDSAGNTIAGNYVGLDLAGNADLGNSQYGIWVTSGGNTIGGTGAGDRNVVSGNEIDGIHIDGGSGNVILGNYVGTNAAGTGAVGNTEDGIWLFNASNNVVGGSTAAARNVLSGNLWSGIGFSGSGSGNVIRGNYIGVDASGAAALPNQIDGINILGSDGAQIGGAGGAQNVIAFNAQDGIAISAGTGHSVLENVIYANGDLGIDIDDNGVTANDLGDADLGTNLRMNFPVIYSVVVSGGTVTVTGEARSGATVRFYEAAADPSGYGEGQSFLGSGVAGGILPGTVDLTARRFSFSFAAGTVNVGDMITATATDASGNTSEFALAVAASATSPAIIVTPTSGLVTNEDGGSASFTVMLATAPLLDVTIGVSSSDTTEGTVSTSSLTFSNANWNVAQTVVVTGVPDALLDGSVAYSIVLAATTTLDLGYLGMNPPDVSVTNLEGSNVAPVNSVPGAQIASEDTPLAIAGLSVSDSNGNLSSVQLGAVNGTLSVSLVGGAAISGGANGSGTLTLSGTQVQINAALATLVYQGNANFAGADTLSMLSTDGGTLSDSDTVALTVNPVNDPAAVTMSVAPLAYAEDDPATAVDPGLTVTDVDSPLLNHAHVTITGNYVAGEDLLEYVYNAALPAITATWDAGVGELTLWGAASAADYQSALRSVTYRNLSDTPSTLTRTITIEVEDGISVDAGSFASRSIDVAAVNDPPTIVSDGGGATASRSVAENTTLVTDVDGADIDLPAQVLSYSIFDGADAGRFTIDALSGVLSFLAAPDRETPTDADLDSVYEVRVQVSDGNGGFGLQALTVTVLDVDEFDVSAPIDADVGANVVAEDATAGTAVGITALATDVDATTNAVSYSLDDDAGGLFTIDAGTGVVRVAGALDAETAVSHGIVVRAVSADGSFATQAFVIAVSDVDDWAVGPVNDTDAAAELVSENLAPGAVVGYTALAIDPDLTSNTVSYSLLDDAGGRFAIDAVSGVVTTAAVLDYEAAASHTITVRATSIDGSSGTALVSIAVGDVNEAPTLTNQSFTLPENSVSGTPVGTVVASDPDAFDVLAYAIVAGDPSGAFAIGASGQITVANSGALDFEATPVFTLDVLVTDSGGLSATGTITVNLTDVNDAPTALDDVAATSEDAPVSVSPAAGVLANDSDLEGGALTVTAVEGNATDVGNTITLASGALLRLNANGSFNYDPNGAFDWLAAGDTASDSFSYEASDPGGASSSAAVTITLSGVNDVPAGFDTTVSATEDTAYVFGVGDFGFADPDSSLQALTIVTLPGQGSLTLSGAPVSAGTVVSAVQLNSGALRFTPAANQNGTGYASFQVRVSDGLASAAAVSRVTIDVAAVNDLPWVGPSTLPGTEDVALNFAPVQFASVFSDIEGDALAQVQIVSLPGSGSLSLSGTPVAAGDVIPVAQLANLAFSPAADWNGSTQFDWRGHDGTAFSAAAATMTLTLAAVNDAPVLVAGAAGGSVLWGDTLALASSLLQVTDVDNTPAQLVYTVASVPGSGTLYRAGVALSAGSTFTQGDIDAGQVSYVNAGGMSANDSFTFTVADGAGGTLPTMSFDIAVGAPPPVPPSTTPPPPPPPTSGGGTGTTTTGGTGGSGTGTGTSTPADELPPPGAVPITPSLDAALTDITAPKLNDATSATRNSVDARAQRVQVVQVVADRSLAGYTVFTNALGPSVTPTTEDGVGSLSFGGTLLSGPAMARAELAAAVEAVSRSLSDTAFVGELDTMRDQLDGKIEVQGKLVASSVAVTGGLSVGYVIWLLRGGLLLTSLLSSLPAWHAVDPMPVLARGGGNDDDEGADEDPLERLFGKAKDRLLGGWFGKGAAPAAPKPPAAGAPHEAADALHELPDAPHEVADVLAHARQEETA